MFASMGHSLKYAYGQWKRSRNLDHKFSRMEVQNIFAVIYNEGLWGHDRKGYFSGSGSASANVTKYTAFLEIFMRENNISHVLDIGCGDFRVMRPLLERNEHLTYTGVDVVSSLVFYLQSKYSNERIQFRCLNAISDKLPDADLVTVRQVLQHLSNKDAQGILGNLNSYKYVLITEHVLTGKTIIPNKDKRTGQYTRLDLNSSLFPDLPPFSLPAVNVFEYDEKYGAKDAVIRTYLVEKNNRNQTPVKPGRIKYDVVVPVSGANIDISKLCIKYLVKNADCNKIFIITNCAHFEHFTSKLSNSIQLLDEDSIIPGISLSTIKEYMVGRNVKPGRAGWYFQQFIKMALCDCKNVSDHYLVWDADTIMLKPIDFFNESNAILADAGSEYHRPYFETYFKITGKTKTAPFSFITEHLMIDKCMMKELISVIGSHNGSGKHWVWAILDAISPEDIKRSGFSEFETYGNFVLSTHPESIMIRPLKRLRYGASKFGLKPNKFDIFRLSLKYSHVSFERWDDSIKIRVIIEKIISYIIWMVNKPIHNKRSSLSLLKQ